MRRRRVTAALAGVVILLVSWKAALHQASVDGSPQEKFDSAVAVIQQYSQQKLQGRIPPLKGGFVLVPVGQTVASRCKQPGTDVSLDYCESDDTIDIGELKLEATDMRAVQFFLSHEFGHHIEFILGMYSRNLPEKELENRADCIGGAITAFSTHPGLLDRLLEPKPDAFKSVGFGQDPTHGTRDERRSWAQLGFTKGITACVDLDLH